MKSGSDLILLFFFTEASTKKTNRYQHGSFDSFVRAAYKTSASCNFRGKPEGADYWCIQASARR